MSLTLSHTPHLIHLGSTLPTATTTVKEMDSTGTVARDAANTVTTGARPASPVARGLSGWALGLYGATASIGFVAGQVFGGVLVEYTSWRSIFLVNIPIGIAAAFLAPLLIVRDRLRGVAVRLDLIGAILSTFAIASLVFGVSEGSVLGWGHPLVIGALVVALIAAAAFVLVERVHPQPLLNLKLLQRPNLATAGILNLVMGIWSAGELVVLSIYLQQSLHDSPLFTGLVIAPQGVVGFVTGIFGARLVRRVGMRRLLIAATLATSAGFLILMHLPSTGHYSPLFIAVVLVGFGTVGTVFGSTVLGASGMADADQGVVGGIVNTARQVGAALGVALLVAIADGADASRGIATIAGDRRAMFAAAVVGLVGTGAAWFGTRHRAEVALPATTNRQITLEAPITADSRATAGASSLL